MHYWVVGAMFGGSDDNLPRFLRRGYWYCWDPRDNTEVPPVVANRFPRINVGDRIAVKRLLGAGATEIEIRALGIITDADLAEWRVYVDWVVPDLSRRVPMHGCAGSLHGPYQDTDAWVRDVFLL